MINYADSIQNRLELEIYQECVITENQINFEIKTTLFTDMNTSIIYSDHLSTNYIFKDFIFKILCFI